MMQVAIQINLKTIKKITAVKIVEPNKNGVAQYRTSDNHVIEHKPRDGAIKLAIKMLKCLGKEEEKSKRKAQLLLTEL